MLPIILLIRLKYLLTVEFSAGIFVPKQSKGSGELAVFDQNYGGNTVMSFDCNML